MEKLHFKPNSNVDSMRLLHQREAFWTYKLQATGAIGLNQHIDMACVL